jgi:hypothetical protein
MEWNGCYLVITIENFRCLIRHVTSLARLKFHRKWSHYRADNFCRKFYTGNSSEYLKKKDCWR